MLKRADKRYTVDFSDSVDYTDQSCLKECDIRGIIDRYKVTGQMPRVLSPELFGDVDVSKVGDYMDAMLLVQAAQEEFSALPAKIRDRFDNDPVKLMEFLNDPSKVDEAVELGLVAVQSKEPQPATPVAGGSDTVITSPAESPSTAPSGVVE